MKFKTTILYAALASFMIPVAHAAVTSCDGITDEAARKRCEFVKEKRDSVKPTALPPQCASIPDDRLTNRRSTYLSDVSKCLSDVKNTEATDALARAQNSVERFADSTLKGLKPGDAYGSCNYMAKNGLVATIPCADIDLFSIDPKTIQKTIATQEKVIPTGDGKKLGVFTLHPGAYWKYPLVYHLYHGSAEVNGIMQNVSFYNESNSTKSFQIGMSLMDPPHIDYTDEDLGAYAITAMVKAPNGIKKEDYPKNVSKINAENEYPTETGKIVTTLEDVGVSMRGHGSGAISTEEEFIDPITGKKSKKKTALVNDSPVSYGIFGFQLSYKSIAPAVIDGTSTVYDSGKVPFGECPSKPGPLPPSSTGYDSDYPVGSTGAGSYGASGNALSVKVQCVNIYLYEWWYTLECTTSGDPPIEYCSPVRHDKKTPAYTVFTRQTVWPFFVVPYSKLVNVNIVNTY